MLFELIAPFGLDDIKVIHMIIVWCFKRGFHKISEILAVAGSNLPAPLVPACKMREPCSQYCCLHVVQPAVDADHVVVVTDRLPVISQHDQLLIILLRPGRYCSPVAEGAEILAGIETKSAQSADAAGGSTPVPCSGCLCSIFYNRDVSLVCKLHQRLHIDHLPVKMNRHYGFCCWSDECLDSVNVKQAGVRVDIYKDRARSCHRNGRYGRYSRVRRHYDLGPWPCPAGSQGQIYRLGAGGAADNIRHAQKAGEFLLKASKLRSENKMPGVEHSGKRCVYLGFVLPVMSGQVAEWDFQISSSVGLEDTRARIRNMVVESMVFMN